MTYTANDVSKEGVRQSERQLEAQQALATAADQRAFAFCAALFVVVPLVIQSMGSDGASWPERISLTLFILSAVLAGYSAKPTRFYGSGGSASGLRDYANEHHAHLVIGQIAKRNDEYLEANDRAIRRSACCFKFSLAIAFAGLLVMYVEVTGIAAWLIEICGG